MSLNDKVAKQLVIDGLTYFYTQLEQGLDVSPGERLRFEGKVELLLDEGLLDWAWLKKTTEQCYVDILNQLIDAHYWLWLEDEGKYYMPYKMLGAHC